MRSECGGTLTALQALQCVKPRLKPQFHTHLLRLLQPVWCAAVLVHRRSWSSRGKQGNWKTSWRYRCSLQSWKLTDNKREQNRNHFRAATHKSKRKQWAVWAVTRSVILSYTVTSEASRKLEAFNPSIHQFIETEMCLCGCMKFGVSLWEMAFTG